ncbi:transketolase C-terminal domain-containing protein [Bacillus swezeyi]|uniref:Transketolase n=1 Tax=Bacillus swezeyi TaxID=1925020 RepID=A0A1R1QK24_9BACI|nr:transketolase C-terminal domain-containing protein [Bacillus swezeyi]MEC1260639.1 transketolase C-terminal domain-containing protein [Bacillus swezeyi]MED2928410.1 transketolase C-terminal domain-containing protein [Bacillus swezeyi]MED2964037.1 transketolase C-terminal domain-containing protein [Bacillus swezeyi]MED3074090.1 transketolase C-terminal domain-containing protein [Bacillus swezeyi]MED3083843.1 transketolase C-terminal domain-containing protein [Bacillus swezeyi]
MSQPSAVGELDAIEMRQAYSSVIFEMAKENKEIIALEADLMSSISMDKIKRKIPEQVINCGVMEANMIGVAAGLSLTGKIPFVHTFAQFATRRCFDQLFVSGAYAKTNIKIFGSDSGITAEHNGGTHMAFEDLGLVRLIPGAFVYEASDAAMLAFLLKKIAGEYGIHYIRSMRKKAVKLYGEHETFEGGKAKVLKDGSDAALFASGIMVAEALKASELLKAKGIEAAVIDMYCMKPIDKETVIHYAEKTKAVVTAENHNVIGGLGSAVAEVLSEHCPVPLKRIGVHEAFGQVGDTDYLKEFYHLTAEHIAQAAVQLV